MSSYFIQKTHNNFKVRRNIFATKGIKLDFFYFILKSSSEFQFNIPSPFSRVFVQGI